MGVGLRNPSQDFLKLNQSTPQTTSGTFKLSAVVSSNFMLYPNLLDIPTGAGVNGGLIIDYVTLPIIDFGINAVQFSGLNGVDVNPNYMGTMFRLDNRGYYPFFQLLRQPTEYEEYVPLSVITTGQVLVGEGWNISNTGTGNYEDLQVYANAYVGGTLQAMGGFKSGNNNDGINLTQVVKDGNGNDITITIENGLIVSVV